MKKNLLLTLSVSLFSIGGMSYADFKASGTDYSTALAAQEKWSEDMANEFVSMPNSFACIIANSGGEVNANAEWTALIDEAACGLADADAKGGTVLSKSLMKSSRASNNSAQEVSSWFNAQGGARYRADVTLKQSADTLPPFGEWYFSFYRAGDYNAGTDTWTSYTKDTANDMGYVDIAKSGDDVAILVATEMYIAENIGGNDVLIDDDTYAKVIFVGGSSDNTKFVGSTNNVIRLKSNGADTGFGDGYSMVAGATSANYYFRQNLDSSGNLVANTNQCFDRTKQFKTGHQNILFDAATGKKVSMSGGFGFSLDDGTRGYLGSWGVWIDGGDVNFTTSKRSIAVKDEDGTSYNLKWAPGKLEQQSFTTENLANGDMFDFWYHSGGKQVDAVWDSANSRFNLFNKGTSTSAGTLSTTQWDQWMWSNTKRASVRWTGGATIDIENRKDLTFSTTFADVKATKFYSKNKYLQHTKASALPYTYSDFSSNGGKNWWEQGGANDGTRKTYFLTGLSPDGSLEPNTLYMDNGDGNLTTADARVRFDFAVNDPQTKQTNYSDGTSATFDENENWWPGSDVTLVLASEADTTGDTCDIAGDDFSGCKTYRWQFGAFPWDHSTAAFNTDGSLVALDDPIMIEYTYAAADDRNNGMSIDIRTQDEYNPLTGCSAIQDSSNNTQDAQGNTYGESCSAVKPADYAGKKFLLEFDGTEVHGLPGMDVCTDDLCKGMKYWIRLVNLKDGTQLTDTKGNKYVILSQGISSTFQEAALANCNDIDFTSLADLGIAASDLPGSINRSSTDYPLPSTLWSEAPTKSKCTVTMGDTSNCN